MARQDLEDAVRAALADLDPGRVALVAVSGGVDSVVLAHAAVRAERARALGHVHHGLRGPAADADQAFVVALGGRLGLPVAVRRVDPQALREGAYGLGATKLEVSTKVVVPAALSGVFASFILAISRAIGETMAVTIAAGNLPNLTLNPLESIQTMTAYIVSVSLGDTPQGTVAYQTLFAVGMTLFVITLAMNILSQWVLSRFRQEYQ